MDERTVFVEKNDSNYFWQEFNMWCVPPFFAFSTQEIAEANPSEH